MPPVQTVFMHHWELLQMEDVGPGDDEINSQKGRHTNVEIDLTKPILEQYQTGSGAQANRLKVHVLYNIKEGRKDYTHLQMSQDILMPVPNDWTNIKILGAADFRARFTIYGKNHRWNPVAVNSVNWLQSLDAKIDGKGDDTEGNAGLSIHFAIPLEYTLKEVRRGEMGHRDPRGFEERPDPR